MTSCDITARFRDGDEAQQLSLLIRAGARVPRRRACARAVLRAGARMDLRRPRETSGAHPGMRIRAPTRPFLPLGVVLCSRSLQVSTYTSLVRPARTCAIMQYSWTQGCSANGEFLQ